MIFSSNVSVFFLICSYYSLDQHLYIYMLKTLIPTSPFPSFLYSPLFSSALSAKFLMTTLASFPHLRISLLRHLVCGGMLLRETGLGWQCEITSWVNSPPAVSVCEESGNHEPPKREIIHERYHSSHSSLLSSTAELSLGACDA